MEAYKKHWEFLESKFEHGNLGHAYLFSGADEANKNIFAKELVKLVNGNVATSDAAIEKEQFPDLLAVRSMNSKSSIENEKDMMEISVEQIRDVQNFLSYKSYYGGYKAVIIHNAERMTPEAQNCFLKNLEEPKGRTLIILISSKAQTLLPTIFSRCQEIKFISAYNNAFSAKETTALQNLLSVVNADLAEKFMFAKKADLTGDNFNNILESLQKYFRNVLLAKLGLISGTQYQSNYTIEKLKNIIRQIETIHFQASTSNASPKLALEVLLLEI
ncbi:MAG: hypothetical protein Q7S10_00745 [bacterium]|nr:hypothetical protein [bacterium]